MFDLSSLPGARVAAPPERLAPQLPLLAPTAPDGGDWLHEIKFDGYRMTLSVVGAQVRLWTRNGYDWSHRFPRLVAALASLELPAAALDAELVVLDEGGRSDFARLQSCAAGGAGRPLLYLFDLVHLAGWDLSRVALIERKELLREILQGRADPEASPLRFSEHLTAPGPLVFDHACRLGLEGIVSKRAASRYAAGKRSPSWLKTKNPHYHRAFSGPWNRSKSTAKRA